MSIESSLTLPSTLPTSGGFYQRLVLRTLQQLPRERLQLQLPDGSTRSHELGPGDYAINPPGVWHTADADGPVTALFVTVGKGTENRPR